MIPQMPDDEKLKFEKEWHDLPDARIEAEIERYLPDTDQRSILLGILEQRRRAADEPEQRRHQQLIRVSLITAAIMLAAAAVPAWFQWHRSPPPAAPANSPAAISPVPTLQESVPTLPESPAVTSPAPTLEESVPTPEDSSAVTSPPPTPEP
jgi:hypothetical protein